ncbi:MAG TPA: tRNA pseudouridine(13) synthase TruD [Polyangia bacterium]|nr:tRNA pseudouridine(13) synthase TruD [Polyangia bacterium]
MLRFVPSPETFTVEEIAAYAPAGEGTHLFLWVEKRGLTTLDAIADIARVLRVEARDVGYAGLKDRHALTRQWLSVAGVTATQALEAPPDPDGRWTILQAAPHPHKLRLGHLRGNRFEAVLQGDDAGDTDRDWADLEGAVDRVVREGVPNRFGAQRFGAAGDNAAVGLALLRGERRERDRRKRRLLLSAAQSAVFNRVLALRAEAGPLTRVREGDVLQKTDTGGLFVTTDLAADQPRVDRGEVVPTGPLPGGREIEPPVGTQARALEDRAIAAVGATREDFASAGRELPGARRAVVVRAQDLQLHRAAAGGRLTFALPAGAYATVLVDAVLPPRV